MTNLFNMKQQNFLQRLEETLGEMWIGTGYLIFL